MLVLSRMKEQSVMIGDDIEIVVVDIRGDKVRLGIIARASIPVHRREVHEAIKREERDSARTEMQVRARAKSGMTKQGRAVRS